MLEPDPEMGGRLFLSQLDKVHPGGVAKLLYFPQEPLLLSIGYTSNWCLIHLFDNSDHSGHLLKQRRGHVAPPKHIRYLHSDHGILPIDGTDATSCQILSGGSADRTLLAFRQPNLFWTRSIVRGIPKLWADNMSGVQLHQRRTGPLQYLIFCVRRIISSMYIPYLHCNNFYCTLCKIVAFLVNHTPPFLMWCVT
jgi:hypothetical protein